MTPSNDPFEDLPEWKERRRLQEIQAMREAADDFVAFDEAYAATDWSAWRELPAFEASNRGNAFRIYLELEPEMF